MIKRVKNKRRVKTRSKLRSISKLIKTADALLSVSVRQLGVNKEGLQRCYTCGSVNHWKKLHNGHYLSRYYKAARWHKDNCRPQCMMCNLWKRGDPIKFRQNLITEIGEERVNAVEALRNAPIKLNRQFLEQLIQSLS